MNRASRRAWRIVPVLVLLLESTASIASDPPLIVVEDSGGASALPYYRALKLQSQPAQPPSDPTTSAPKTPFTEASALPVRSTRLTPGPVTARSISAPGLTPFFIIGDDSRSRDWLRRHLARLRDLHAVGAVVNVESAEALDSLRRLAPGLRLSPAAGDDLAQRLALTHYPLLITADAIEQ